MPRVWTPKDEMLKTSKADMDGVDLAVCLALALEQLCMKEFRNAVDEPIKSDLCLRTMNLEKFTNIALDLYIPMHFYSSFLSLFLVFIFFTLVTNTTSQSSCGNETLLKCSSQFQCGNLNSVEYPFWGNNRPSYCGKPDLELKCNQNNFTEIQIMSKTHRILKIFQENQTLRVASMDFWNDVCPTPYQNATLNITQFNYSIPSTRNLSLFYDCPVSATTSPNLFTCQDSNRTSDAYFLNETIPSDRKQNLTACNVRIEVPVLRSAYERLMNGQTALWAVFREGFDVVYDSEDLSCKPCRNSSGECGYDWESRKSICYRLGDQARCPIARAPEGGAGPVTSPTPNGGSTGKKIGIGLHGVTTIDEEEIARKMILVGLWCIQIDPSDRPPISRVIEMLEGSLQALQVPPKPFLSSPTRGHDHSSTTSASG
ncbi:hypothetical protein IFM89_004839 [Coptis chinensis]|uniref:Uncharacterized protein n=1 Tax=Coptis chinensis TaxID=261450 RepID=A0A835LEF5_9MAGN|nr:hypothetical protein IFM89_004839 [Coptis chinensis]